MFETIINLKPKQQWRPGVTLESLTAEMDRALQFPGVSNAWTMPIKSRIDMLSTGIRTPVGVKVIGTDLAEIDKLAKQIEQVLRRCRAPSSAYAERVLGGYYLDIVPDREALARYGIDDPGRAGRDRHRARRPDRDHHGGRPPALRASTCAIRAICATVRRRSPATCWCRCRAAARCRSARSRASRRRAGRASIRTENGQLAVYIYVDIRDRDHRRLRRRRAARGAGQRHVSAGLLCDVERAVRISRARRGAAEDRGAGDAADHLPAALPQLPLASPRR